jgi:hypothetical protein
LHKWSASSSGRRMQACPRQQRPPLEVLRGAVFQEEYHSRGSDATPTQAGVGSSCGPHASEAEGSYTSRCADANRLRVPAGSSRLGAGERVIRCVENESHDGERLLGWGVEAPGGRCGASTFEDLRLPVHHGNGTG